MKPLLYLLFTLFFATALFAQTEPLPYPIAFKDTTQDIYFGTRVQDPYRWLEDDTAAATKQWLKEEKAISAKYLTHITNKYRFDREIKLNGYISFGTLSKQGKYYFDFYRDHANKPAVMYIKKKIDGLKSKIIDPQDFATDNRDMVSIEDYKLSDDGDELAFSVSHSGTDWREIRIIDVHSYHILKEVLTDVKFSNIAWSGSGFFYHRYPKGQRDEFKNSNINPALYYHRLGTPQGEDRLIYEDKYNHENVIDFDVIGNGKYLVLYNSFKQGKIRLHRVLLTEIKGGVPGRQDTIISSTQHASFEVLGLYNNRILVSTTLDAPRGKLLLFDKEHENQADLFADQLKETLVNASIIGNKVVCTYLDDINYQRVTYDTAGNMANVINFPDGCSVSSYTGGGKDSLALYYMYSFIYPPIAFEYNANSFESKLVEKTKLTYDYDKLVMEKVHYKSKDGVEIPMIIAYKKGMKHDGKNATILYGYGGYGTVMTPFFNAGFITHLESGGIVALPCLRGGGELGEEWHEKGTRLDKQNVFNDFIAAAEYLFKEGYTSPQKLAIMGGSNGGLLVGAVMDQRPDICRVVIAEKGVYDMLRYQKFTIGNAWKNEYGASDDSVQFRNLIKYSPLHNVRDTTYPSVLIITADHDDRVAPLHSYKYAAALQAKNKGANPILLVMQKNDGHTSYDKDTEELIYSFIYSEMGIPPGKVDKSEVDSKL